MWQRKCYGTPDWEPPGLSIESWVEGGCGRCQLCLEQPSEHVVRVKNFSPYTQLVTVNCWTDSSHILYSKDDTGNEQNWQETFRVPGRSKHQRRECSVRQVLLVEDASSHSSDENVWIATVIKDDARMSQMGLPDFVVQVDIK